MQEGDYVERGEPLIDGTRCRTTSCACSASRRSQKYLVNEIQEVYRLQGVKINDKHIEVIVRQMLQKVEITDAGDTKFLMGEQVDRRRSRTRTTSVQSRTAAGARPMPVLLGITKASLQTKSFISAASVPGDDACADRSGRPGRVDTLRGLKENVIIGRLIPAGTGEVVNRMKAIAAQRDRAILASRGESESEGQALPSLEQEQAADD